MANARGKRTGKNVNTNAKPLPKTAPAGNIYVYCGIPNGIRFSTPAGEVFLKGVNTATLVQTDGGRALSAGKYGINPVSTEAWNYIKKAYAEMAAIKNGLIFAETAQDKGNEEAQERQNIPTGAEQANIEDMTQEAEQAGLDPSQFVTAASGA